MADLEKYPKTDKFRIIDTIGTPHPFCITQHHIGFASDNCGGILGEHEIKAYERKIGKPSCGMSGCSLWFHEHEHALLVEVNDDRELRYVEGLQEYLQSCLEMCKEDGFTGFAFKKKEK